MPAAAFLLSLLAGAPAADTVVLRPGLVLTRSAVIRAGEYRLAPPAGDSAVVRVRGNDIVVDFAGAVLAGADPDAPPDRAAGIGILVEAGSRITIRNARIRGYRVGLLAREVAGFSLLDSDLSHNWKPRLWSGPGHESLADWLSFHRNDRDEWLRYGAAVYLAGVTGGEIRGNVARQGMNALLLVRSTGLRIWNNDFSFNSGLGIGLYRASRNTIMHNRADWCMRGYVHGVYSRGQDSAALLLYEQSSHNVVAYNSMTHSGDGVFLWAGQSTMDTGQGGSNDNLFFGNDFSFAAANAIEVTFSRNRMIHNRLEGSNYGIWGGYSFESEIRANRFAGNSVGVAIEHGQDNRILDNLFLGDPTAIRLWWNRIAPSDWGYPKQRDTRSRDYRIEGNTFSGNRVALRADSTLRVRWARNRVVGVDSLLVVRSDTGDWSRGADVVGAARRAAAGWTPDRRDPAAPRALPGGRSVFLDPRDRQGREHIIIDEWGPYDWRAPRLWPAHRADSSYAGGPLALRVLGPPGRWRLAGTRGVRHLSDSAGTVGDTIVVTPAPGPLVDWEVQLEAVGGEMVAPNGRVTRAGRPYAFAWRAFRVPADWDVKVFSWDSLSDPRSSPDAFRARLGGAPVAARREPFLDWQWYRPSFPGVPAERYAVTAEGRVTLPPGEYELVTISDDGVRVFVDDRLVIDNWSLHESAVDRVPLEPGAHRLRVEYFQVGGWAELRVDVRKRDP
ncbi:MAG TPA: NosD domain-containing protein [Gemmatimonadales bacterium]|nr:NosD domain-containing protein [Gemmatimonadales bacterium]